MKVHLPGVAWIGIVVAVMTVLPQLGLPAEWVAIATVLLGAVAKALQLYFKVPEAEMPVIPGGPQAQSTVVAQPKPPAPQGTVSRFFWGS